MEMKLYYTCFGNVQKHKTIGLMYKTGSIPVSPAIYNVFFTRDLAILDSTKNTNTDRVFDKFV